MDLRHQASAMCVIRLWKKTHLRGLQQKPHTSHYLSRPVSTIKSDQQPTHISHYTSRMTETKRKKNNTTHADCQVEKKSQIQQKILCN